MRRDVEHARVIPEDLLRPIAVMDIPVDDEHALVAFDELSCGDGNVVEETKAHSAVVESVVTRWPRDDEADPLTSALELANNR